MRITDLIYYLEELKEGLGDLVVLAFHHEGGNSLRAYPGEITNDSFLLKNAETLVIGGYYNPPNYYADSYEKIND
jgi:hypothetical protein